MKLQVLPTPPQKNFICTWCADSFATRDELTNHWVTSPKCGRNRSASNQTQSKYLPADNAKTVAGEHILRLVRSRDCLHQNTTPLLEADRVTVIGYQCDYCYSVVGPRGEV